jgi:hypothetical protein
MQKGIRVRFGVRLGLPLERLTTPTIALRSKSCTDYPGQTSHTLTIQTATRLF